MLTSVDEFRAAVARYYDTAHRPYREISISEVTVLTTADEELITLPAEEVLRESHRLLILGGPGSGKTTLLDRHAYDLANSGSVAPIFAPLRRYVTTLRDLLEAQVNRFANLTLPELAMPPGKDVAILLDGLDEVAPPLRNRAIQDIQEIDRQWSEAQIIITTRSGYNVVDLAGKWRTAELLPLTDEQVRVALSRFSPAVAKEIFASRRLLAMARRPLFLHTILAEAEQPGDVRQYVIDAATQYFVWRGHSKSLLPADVPVEAVGRGLELLAIEFVRRRVTWLDVETASALLAMDPALETAGIVQAVFDTDVIENDGERLRFSHLSYTEAYAAKYLRSSIRTTVSVLDLRAVLDSPSADRILADLFKLLSFEERSRFISQCTTATLASLMRFVPEEMAALVHDERTRIQPTHVVVEALKAADRAEYRDKPRRDVLVIAVHGFNTRGPWKNTLSVLLNLETDGTRFIYAPWDYGQFTVGILNPFARRRKLDDFQVFYNAVLDTYGVQRPEVCAVAHSFGTYLVCNSMRLFDEIRFDRLILLRSVLPRRFPWTKLAHKCSSVLSELGGSDGALIFAQFVPGLGASGRYGFKTPGEIVREHVNEYGEHSTVFGARYMRESWIPFLRGEHPS
ncbi:MAG TPA: hypothetical protein VNN25_09190 [Thermoanaerobaculia bacterium]|nr:hypothetical protein [Thermoanaerobaculia bacterium]